MIFKQKLSQNSQDFLSTQKAFFHLQSLQTSPKLIPHPWFYRTKSKDEIFSCATKHKKRAHQEKG